MEEIKINPSGDETQEQGLNQEQGQAQGQKQDQEQEHQEQQAHPVIDGHPEFEFTITNSGADLYNFLLYHNYRSIQGAIGLFISAAALLLLIFNFQTLDYIKMVCAGSSCADVSGCESPAFKKQSHAAGTAQQFIYKTDYVFILCQRLCSFPK